MIHVKFVLMILMLTVLVYAGNPYVDEPFIQEYHEPYPISETGSANDVKTIHVDHDQNVWAGTKIGLFKLDKDSKNWISFTPKDATGPVFDIYTDQSGRTRVAAWNGVYTIKNGKIAKDKGISKPVAVLAETADVIRAFGPDGNWIRKKEKWHFSNSPYSAGVRAVIPDKDRGFWIATIAGLYHQKKSEWKLYQDVEALITPYAEDIEYDQKGRLWVGTLGGVNIRIIRTNFTWII